MKRLWAVTASLLLLMTGCRHDAPPIDPPIIADTTQPPETQAETDVPKNTDAPLEQPPTAAAQEDHNREVFRKTLEALHDKALLPSGTELETEGDLEANRFAVTDLDGDGREELVLEITQTAPEDSFTAVYDVDADGDLRREVRYSAEVTFWTDGIVIATYKDAAESEEDFVPYAAAQYDADQDVYTEFAYVAAIDRDKLEAADLLDEYPDDVDTSDTGRVYCIHGDTPVDVTEYEAWYNSWHAGITQTEVPFETLTKEHIEDIH